MNKVTDLTKTEYEVMDILWSTDQPLLLLEILDLIEEKYHRGWKRQTLCTYLSHLVDKGVIETYRKGRYFYYKAIISKKKYQEIETKHFMNYWFNNSISNFLSALTNSEIASEKERGRIEELIDELDD